MNKQEKDVLVSYGWQDEGIAFRTAPMDKNRFNVEKSRENE